MDIKSIKGIGNKTAELFEKLGVGTVEELLEYYPVRYEYYEEPTDVQSVEIGALATIAVTIVSSPKISLGGRYKILSVNVRDHLGTPFVAIWYNMTFLRGKLKIGYTYILRGKLISRGQNIIMEQSEIFSAAEYERTAKTLKPVYHLTKGLSNKTIIKAVSETLEKNVSADDYLPADIKDRFKLEDYGQAVRNIHFPKDEQALESARNRLVFDEFFKFIMVMKSFRVKGDKIENMYVIARHDETGRFINNLPFSLTDAQKSVLEDIRKDLSGETAMNRLIQGDVGSGKTIVALIAMVDAALSGYQAVMMAPTEVLARQHYSYIKKTVKDNNMPFEVSILTGSMDAASKRTELEKIKTGKSKIIVGTHALIQSNVIYDKVALVITDEQHRFGVRQREKLAFKGVNPHILVMSATPIPRTLAIILYGDLDISVIKQMPSDRLPIKNCVVGTNYRPNAYRFILNEIRAGHQAYIICAMVEESENIDAENVIAYTSMLKKNMPDDIHIEYIHGRMKGTEKNTIMQKFADGDIDILVSTTVIEVGVNVPNATVMLVEDAQRFGLAALHQLRGRVGRGKYQSYCIFINSSDDNSATERLNILNSSNDGFYIASQDMKLRGPGEFFGIRQSGDTGFNIADIYTDADALKNASIAAEMIDSGEIIIRPCEVNKFESEMTKCIKKASDKINL